MSRWQQEHFLAITARCRCLHLGQIVRAARVVFSDHVAVADSVMMLLPLTLLATVYCRWSRACPRPAKGPLLPASSKRAVAADGATHRWRSRGP